MKTPFYFAPLRRTLLLVFFCGALPVCAQQSQPGRIEVGSSVMSGVALQPYKNLWKFSATLEDGTIRDLGTWSDELKPVELNGRALLQRTQVATYSANGRKTTDLNVFDPKTLAPVMMDWSAGTGSFNHREFNGATIVFRRLSAPGGQVEQGTVKLEQPVFDFHGGMYGLLLVGLPLKEGLTASLPAIDENKEILTWVNIHVYRQEPVDAGSGKKIAAWLVECDTNQGLMKFWLTKAPPYIIRLVFYSSNGITWTYEMV
jgi:hypothetical protein